MNPTLSNYWNNGLANAARTTGSFRHSYLPMMLAMLVIVLAPLAALAQPTSTPAGQKPPFPSISLPDRAQGQQALSQLGSRLPEVAAWYGMSVPQFSNMIRFDRKYPER